jgi:glycyl-tRNA synthetase
LAKPATSVEKRGPSVEQVFGKDGVLTPAGEGFFRSVNKTPLSLEAIKRNEDSDVVIRAVKGVDYLVATKHVAGRPSAEILAEQLPNLILNLDFPKKMRWGNLAITYARPLRWLLALFGKHIVPFVIGDLSSDRLSWGHRQLANHSFSIPQASNFVEDLLEHHVMVKTEERKNRICLQLDALESSLSGTIIARDKVLPQVVNLVEWPEVMAASFDTSFLRIPKEVLISEMVEHQKYFPVADNDGKLMNQFVITANTTPSNEIAQGNQKVLSARLSDGVFLYEQGIKVPLLSYNEKLQNITFQKALGTVHDKVERLKRHAIYLQKILKISTQEKAMRAASLSKADLASEMVHEFPELQGVIGRYYADAQGEDKEVAMAIEEQWMPRKEGDSLPATETGILLSLADKFDNIVGCFIANLKPTSSSDPYALRRQAFGIVKMLINAKAHLPLSESLAICYDHFLMAQQKEKHPLIEEIETFFSNRVKTVFMDDGFLKDEIEAALSFGFDDIYDAFCKVQALHHFRKNDPKFSLLWEVYKRAKGQLEGQKEQSLLPNLLKEDAEKNLHTALSQSSALFTNAIAAGDYDKAYQLISELQAPLAVLFEQVKIMDDDLALRANRLALLQQVFERFSKLLDFSKIQISKAES